MADVTLSFTIPKAKVETALAGFLKIYPNNETIQDPEADPEINTPIAKYTNAQWVREKIRRIIIKNVRRGLQMTVNEKANITDDDSLVT